jgi:predicted helicase
MKRDPYPISRKPSSASMTSSKSETLTERPLSWPAGTGKTVLGAADANELAATWTVVFLPSIALVKQTLDCWRDQLPLGTNYLCVCSDQGVASAQDELAIDAEELAVNDHRN